MHASTANIHVLLSAGRLCCTSVHVANYFNLLELYLLELWYYDRPRNLTSTNHTFDCLMLTVLLSSPTVATGTMCCQGPCHDTILLCYKYKVGPCPILKAIAILTSCLLHVTRNDTKAFHMHLRSEDKASEGVFKTY